jgi:hypothetical protein
MFQKGTEGRRVRKNVQERDRRKKKVLESRSTAP